MILLRALAGRTILDCRGRPTLEAEAVLSDGFVVRASVPQGESRGGHEAYVVSPESGVRAIAKKIAPAFRKWRVWNQCAIDAKLCALDGTPDKRRLGGNVLLAVSIAMARAIAHGADIPLWRSLRRASRLAVPRGDYPRLLVNLIEGGVHAENNLAFQEHLLIPRTRRIAEAVRIALRVEHALHAALRARGGSGIVPRGDEGGFAPRFKNNEEPLRFLATAIRVAGVEGRAGLGIDAAGNQVALSVRERMRWYALFRRKYGLCYLEDPFGEEDFARFRELSALFGADVIVAGDDLTVTNLGRMARAAREGAVSGVIVKPNQIGTVSEAIEAVRFARREGWAVVASHRGSETNDDFIADFACAVGADGVKIGGPAHGERIAKYNRLLAIEREKGRS